MFERFRWFLQRKAREQDMQRELQCDVEMEIEELIEAGIPRSAAERRARVAFGNQGLLKEDLRTFWRLPLMDRFLADVSYALRQMRNNPAFTLIAVLTLALGIGASAAVFSVVDTLLLQRPQFEHIDRLVTLMETNREILPPNVDGIPASPANFLDWREQAGSFDRMTAFRLWYFTLADPQGQIRPELVRGARVSSPFFEMLGITSSLGRTFGLGEDEPGRDQIVVLSHALWQGRFNANPSVIGRTMLVDGRSRTIIGVLPEHFQFYVRNIDLWIPWNLGGEREDRDTHASIAHARLAPGISMVQAQAEMDEVAGRLEKAYPESNDGWGVLLKPLYLDTEVESMRSTLYLLLGASGFVLLIACANVANLLLFRGAARKREIAIRSAIGATRRRLVLQMMTESLLLAMTGAALGVPLAYAGARVLMPMLPHNSVNPSVGAWASTPSIDLRMLAFSVAVAATSVLVFGLLPAARSTRTRYLGVRNTQGAPRRFGSLLTMVEIGLSIVLLVGAGLLLESFWRFQSVDPGFPTENLLTMQLWLPPNAYPENSDISGFHDEMLRRTQALLEVEAAGVVNFMPFNGMGVGIPVEIEGQAPERAMDRPFINYRVVTPGYIQMLGQPLLAGRDFAESDDPDAVGVTIINRSMKNHFWPNEDPVGKRIRPGFFKSTIPWVVNSGPRYLTIIGIVEDVKELRLDRETEPVMYVSHRQFPSAFSFLMFRTRVPPRNLLPVVENQIRALDKDLAVSNVLTMDEAMSAATPRFNVQLFSAFGGIAILLSAVGVYGVASYSVGQRRQEFAVRMALGAKPGNVLAMVLREGLLQAVAGVIVDLAGASLLTRTMTSMLFNVKPTDPAAFLGASTILFSVALFACYVPARRATTVDPLVALRHE